MSRDGQQDLYDRIAAMEVDNGATLHPGCTVEQVFNMADKVGVAHQGAAFV